MEMRGKEKREKTLNEEREIREKKIVFMYNF